MTTTGLPADDALEQASLQRRRALADSLFTSGMRGSPNGQMVGRVFVPNIGQQFLDFASVVQGRRMQDQVDKETADLQQRLQQRLQSGMAKYLEMRQGTPDEPMGPPDPLTKEMGVAPGRPANPLGAAATAIGSGIPTLQQLGMKDIEEFNKSQMTPKEWLSAAAHFDPQSVVKAAQGGGLGALAPKPQTHVVNGQLIEHVPGSKDPAIPRGDFRDRYGDPYLINGDLYQTEAGTNKRFKLDNAPKITNTVQGGNAILPKGQTKGAEKLFSEAADTVAEMGKGARASVGLMSTLGQLEELTKSGTLGGPGANIGIFLGQLGRSMGLPIDPKTVNSENFVSIAKEAVHKLAQPYGGGKGLTAPEMAQLDKVIPQLEQSPEARLQLIAILRGAAQRNIEDFRKADAAYKRALKADDVELLPTFETFVPNEQPTAPVPGVPVPQAPAGSGARVEGGVVVRGWPKQ